MATGSTKAWTEDGFVILPAFVPETELRAAVEELPQLFPTAEEFHDDPSSVRAARFGDEFGGIDSFPFNAVEVSLLSVHPRLIELAATLLGTDLLRVYSIEAWAKYTGATDYEQHHHRDYLSQTLVAPSANPDYQQVEMFLYLCDIPAELGPPSFVPRRHTTDRPAIPNFLPRLDGAGLDETHPTWISQQGSPELYDLEVSGAGPAGTVAVYANDTFHRATSLTAPRGVRYTIHVNFRPAGVDWISRHSWQKNANSTRWHNFVAKATPRQLALFGFPPPGHPYWTEATIEATALRYPELDLTPWTTNQPEAK